MILLFVVVVLARSRDHRTRAQRRRHQLQHGRNYIEAQLNQGGEVAL